MAFREPKKNFNSILCIRANAVSDFRIDFAARYLERASYDVETITYVPFYKASQYDLIICCRPGIDMIEFLKVCLIGGKKVIVDLDDDFNSIPKHNPAYGYTGAGHPTYLRELRRLLQHPGVITTYASAELQNRYKHEGVVIPNSWDDENENWNFQKVKHDREGINIGFTGTATHREDFAIIEPVIKKLLDEYKNLRIVVQLDEFIYKHFNDYEMQRLFLPPLPFPDYPLSFRMFDILAVPLRDTRFNRAKSDIKLLECGASKTPYVASKLPVYEEWGWAGLTVADDEWYEALKSLIDNEKMRREMGESGYEKAQTRKASLVNNKWVELVEELLK